MAYLGSTPTTQSFIAGTDTFSGTGAQVAFTLTRAVNSVNDILVVVNNVDQQPSAYSVSGTTLTFTAAPSSGTNNVYVRYLSTTLQSIGVGQGSVSPASLTTGGPYWDASGNVGIGTTSPAVVQGTGLQISDRSTLSQLTINDSTYLTNNLAYDGTNWRYIVTGFGSIYTVGALGTTSVFRAASGTAGAIATLGESTRTDASGGFYFDSGYGSAAVAYGCRAWVNFIGTGVITIRASGNISSVSDNGVGNYSVFFINNMPNENYSLPAACFHYTGVSNGGNVAYANLVTNAFQILTSYNNGILFDPATVTASVFR